MIHLTVTTFQTLALLSPTNQCKLGVIIKTCIKHIPFPLSQFNNAKGILNEKFYSNKLYKNMALECRRTITNESIFYRQSALDE